ncbi:MAG TPA: 3-deoxy-7-phosphoheptulonate synthase, partial [Allosphingosinicella sp.]
MTANWTPGSWRGHEARQQPAWPDEAALDGALRELTAYPALVGAAEARRLTADIAEAQAGRAFLLQGGDCAESFAEFSPGNIRALHTLLSGMAERLAAAG